MLNECTQTTSSAVGKLKRTRLLALISGLVARGALNPPSEPATDDAEDGDTTIRKRPATENAMMQSKPATSRAALRTPVIPLDSDAVAARKQRKQQHKEAFAKHVAQQHRGRSRNPIRLLHRLSFKQPPPQSVPKLKSAIAKKSDRQRQLDTTSRR